MDQTKLDILRQIRDKEISSAEALRLYRSRQLSPVELMKVERVRLWFGDPSWLASEGPIMIE